MKKEGARVVITLYSYILDAHVHLMVRCGGESNSFKLEWMSLLTTRLRKIYSKIKVVEWSQKTSHCKSVQMAYDAQG